MKLNIYSWGICRTPVFSMDCKIGDVWQELKKMIAYSSSTFYSLLREHDVDDMHTFPDKVRFTLWKYFNRSRFRATPYGEFAAFSLVPINSLNQETDLVTVATLLISHNFQNWTSAVGSNGSFAEIASNVSFYRAGDEIRYIKTEDDVFHLASVEYDPLIFDMLSFCKTKRDAKAVYSFLTIDNALPLESAEFFVQQLIEEQLLLTDVHPNIIGKDYFTRIGVKKSESDKPYVIAERKVLSGAVLIYDEKALKDALHFLSKHADKEPPETLLRFRRNFSRQYETKLVPLLLALDPEIGIGYGDYSGEAGAEQLTDKLLKRSQMEQTSLRRAIFTELDCFILNQIQSGASVIDLDQYEDEKADNEAVLPNTFSAIVEKVDESVYLKSVGGSNAGSLSGRFTLASQELQEVMRSLTKIEEEANPNVLFFDIAYSGEKKVDNINRRSSIYNYELPILSWSTSENVIDINDVYVTIRNNEIVLYSKSHRKRIVPRLATAYNYTRSDLSLFRFLTDLQHQGIQSNLTYDIQDVFPNLDFYPRVVYQSIIVSPARWRVPKLVHEYKKESLTNDEALEKVEDWLSLINVGDCFICKEGDQTLLFKKTVREDLVAFAMYLSVKKNVYIEEGLLAERAVVEDDMGKPYQSEFVLNFWHDRRIYTPFNGDFPEQNGYAKEVFLPGDQWLCYELYCHSIRSNEFLLSCILPLLEVNQDHINKWFFIRYNDPSYHIRLRIEVDENCKTCIINNAFNNAINEWIQCRKISEIKIKPYRREIERYGGHRIREVEEYFCCDSEFVLGVLQETNDIYEFYDITMQFIENALAYANYDTEQQFFFSKRMGDLFAEEHEIDKAGFKIINSDYNKNLRTKSENGDLRGLPRMHHATIKAGRLIRECEEQKKDSLAADLFHMHINRLFHNEGRMHELIVYQFLSLKLKRVTRSKVHK